MALPKSLLDNPRLARWLRFEPGGRLSIFTGKVELGQGILTALRQIVAEELDLDPGRIDLVSGDTRHSPDEGFTAGSLSVEIGGAALRLAAAEARARLLAAAGERLEASAGELSVENGAILKRGAATNLDLWSLADAVDWQAEVIGGAPLKPASAYRIVGRSLPRVDLAAKLAGGGFIHDMTLAGMLHARILRQPFRGAALARFDEARFQARHPGIQVVRRADFLALLSSSEHAVAQAIAAAGALADWREHEDGWQAPDAPEPRRLGSGTAGEAGPPVLDARYARPLIAHASIAPSCALARMADGRLSVWTHSQGVFALRAEIARVLALNPALVAVIHVQGAGCYGHNAADDAGMDAAILAALLPPGTPVRVQWTREDELSLGPLGAAQEARIEAGLDAEGRINGWRMAVTSLPHVQRPGAHGQVNLTSAEAIDRGFRSARFDDLPEPAGGGASRNALAFYDFAQDVTVRLTASRIRTSSLRALGGHLNVFAIESAMDELAAAADADPLAFRLAHLSDKRARAVLLEAAAMSDWDAAAPSGEGWAKGLAIARYKNKGAWCAAAAAVRVEEAVRVERLWLAVDAGLLVNPEGARSQIEGGAIQAVSWTLREEVPVENGRVPPLDWERYPILRFSEVPGIETRFLAVPGRPSLGAGECAQGPVTAAIGNAVARALGVRLRSLPLTRRRLIEAMAGD